MPSTGDEALAQQLTTGGGFEAQESADGKWLYYTRGRGAFTLWKVAPDGNSETPVADFEHTGNNRIWRVTSDGIWFGVATDANRSALQFYNFSDGRIIQRATFNKRFPTASPGLSLTPDGRSFLFPLIEQSGSDLRLLTISAAH